MHFVSRPSAPSEVEALLHQFLQSLERGRTCFGIMAPFCGGQARNRFAVPGDENVMAFFCFSQQARELLVGLTGSDGTHFSFTPAELSLL
jgi:hypothetical protein